MSVNVTQFWPKLVGLNGFVYCSFWCLPKHHWTLQWKSLNLHYAGFRSSNVASLTQNQDTYLDVPRSSEIANFMGYATYLEKYGIII